MEQVDGVTIIGVASRDDDVAAMADFVADTGTGAIPHIADVSGDVWASFGVIQQPAWVFINDDGTAELNQGDLEEAELVARLQDLAAR